MYKVIAVVDRNFGERLAELPSRMPVWVVDTPANILTAHRLWKERSNVNHLEGVTTFLADLASSCETNFLHILPTIDEHHGPFSADPPYKQIELFGNPLTSAIRAALAEYGFDRFQETAEGFVATRERIPPMR